MRIQGRDIYSIDRIDPAAAWPAGGHGALPGPVPFYTSLVFLFSLGFAFALGLCGDRPTARGCKRNRFAGQCLGSWDLMRVYDLVDADGTRPDWGAVDLEARRETLTSGMPDPA